MSFAEVMMLFENKRRGTLFVEERNEKFNSCIDSGMKVEANLMSQAIFNEVIEAILKQTDIVDVVGRYVHLTKQGHYLKGLCPFHSEKTPSFKVAPEKQIYKCVGCGAGGNAIQFLMGVEGYTFVDAVKELAKETGVPLDIDENT
jgi:hypothetical protein